VPEATILSAVAATISLVSFSKSARGQGNGERRTTWGSA
jgi:hypothetical protein